MSGYTYFPYFTGTTNATSANSITVWPQVGLQPLPSVLARGREDAPMLNAIEWLESQIDDVCALATA